MTVHRKSQWATLQCTLAYGQRVDLAHWHISARDRARSGVGSGVKPENVACVHVLPLCGAPRDLCDKRSLLHFDRTRHLVTNRDPLSGDGQLMKNSPYSLLRFCCPVTNDLNFVWEIVCRVALIVFISMSDTKSLLLLENRNRLSQRPNLSDSHTRSRRCQLRWTEAISFIRGKSRSLQFISVSLTLGWTRLHVTSCRAIASSHAHGGCYCNLLLTRLWSKAVEIMQNRHRRRRLVVL